MRRTLPALVILLVALAAVFGCSPAPKKTESIIVALAPFESLAPVYVAQERDMFAANGLKVTYREYATGAAAMEGVLNGEADVAVGTAEFPLVRKAFEGSPARAIASIDRPDFVYLIGRKDRGIEKPADLKGKRVGTAAGSIAQFYLGRFLELNGMSAADITFVDLKTPAEWRAAIEKGDVDAVVLAQPEASLVEDRLGVNATFLSVQGSQPAYTLAIARNDWIAKNPGRVKGLLTALAQAEDFIDANPGEMRRIVQKRLGLSNGYMDLVAKQNDFALSLDQSLIAAMEDEARWLIRNKLTTATVVPDFVGYVDVTGLKAVRPEAVNIGR